MKFFVNRNLLPWWLLIISLAFNVGFGATFGFRNYQAAIKTPTDSRNIGRGTMSMVFAHDELDLSPEQEKQIQQINENLLVRINEQRARMASARNTLAELLSQTNLDQESVARQLDLIGEIQRSAQQLVIDHLLQEKQVLRQDQIEVFNRIIRNRVCPGDGSGGFGPGRGRRDGSGGGKGRRQGGNGDG